MGSDTLPSTPRWIRSMDGSRVARTIAVTSTSLGQEGGSPTSMLLTKSRHNECVSVCSRSVCSRKKGLVRAAGRRGSCKVMRKGSRTNNE